MRKIFIFPLASLLFIGACNSNKNIPANNSSEEAQIIYPEHSSRTSLDWAGAYYGILPCADCSGIETIMEINQDNSFVKIANYIGGEYHYVGHDTIRGNFEWLEDGNRIKISDKTAYNGSPYFKIEENRIRLLDIEGNIIEGKFPENVYTLIKDGNPNVEDRKWQLVELNGKSINGKAESHFIYFDSKTNRISAKAGCNSISFDYRIRNNSVLKFEKGLSTMMACSESIDNEYMNAIENSTQLYIEDGKMFFYEDHTRKNKLAAFEIVMN